MSESKKWEERAEFMANVGHWCLDYKIGYLQGINEFKEALKKEIGSFADKGHWDVADEILKLIDIVKPLNHDTGGDKQKK